MPELNSPVSDAAKNVRARHKLCELKGKHGIVLELDSGQKYVWRYAYDDPSRAAMVCKRLNESVPSHVSVGLNYWLMATAKLTTFPIAGKPGSYHVFRTN